MFIIFVVFFWRGGGRREFRRPFPELEAVLYLISSENAKRNAQNITVKIKFLQIFKYTQSVLTNSFKIAKLSISAKQMAKSNHKSKTVTLESKIEDQRVTMNFLLCSDSKRAQIQTEDTD